MTREWLSPDSRLHPPGDKHGAVKNITWITPQRSLPYGGTFSHYFTQFVGSELLDKRPRLRDNDEILDMRRSRVRCMCTVNLIDTTQLEWTCQAGPCELFGTGTEAQRISFGRHCPNTKCLACVGVRYDDATVMFDDLSQDDVPRS